MSERRPAAGHVPATEDAYLLERQAHYKHEEAVAATRAHRDTQLARLKGEAAEHRRIIAGYIFGALAAATVIIVVAYILFINAERTREQQRQVEQQRAEVAQVCIDAGNIWVDGDCLITRNTD